MNKFAKKWVEALESGLYQQGRGKLRHGDKFCCLGVACDLYDKNKWHGENYLIYTGDDCHVEVNSLTKDVRDALGLRDIDGQYINEYGRCDSLALNNDAGLTFKEIAAIIKSKPTGLFIE